MFLHPVNVRCLQREYGSLEASPHTITATVVEIEGQTITEVSDLDLTMFVLEKCTKTLFLLLHPRNMCNISGFDSLGYRRFAVDTATWLTCRSPVSSVSVSWPCSPPPCPKRPWTALQVRYPNTHTHTVYSWIVTVLLLISISSFSVILM